MRRCAMLRAPDVVQRGPRGRGTPQHATSCDPDGLRSRPEQLQPPLPRVDLRAVPGRPGLDRPPVALADRSARGRGTLAHLRRPLRPARGGSHRRGRADRSAAPGRQAHRQLPPARAPRRRRRSPAARAPGELARARAVVLRHGRQPPRSPLQRGRAVPGRGPGAPAGHRGPAAPHLLPSHRRGVLAHQPRRAPRVAARLDGAGGEPGGAAGGAAAPPARLPGPRGQRGQVPPHQVPRGQALLDLGGREHDRPARDPGGRGRRAGGRLGDHGHGPPRPAQRDDEHHGPDPGPDLLALHRRRPAREPRARRREVPPGLSPPLPDPHGQGDVPRAGLQPQPPRGDQPGDDGARAGGTGSRARARPLAHALRVDPRRRGGHRRR